jgi:hypothetical protein
MLSIALVNIQKPFLNHPKLRMLDKFVDAVTGGLLPYF